MQHLKLLALIVSIAGAYFISGYFAVAALLPEYALPAGLIVMTLAMIIYRILVATGMDEAGLPMGLLLFGPVICLTAGAIWWILRLLGWWTIK